MNILVLNGPNLNLLGTREPEIYGHTTLEDINSNLVRNYPEVNITFKQSNSESELITWIGDSPKNFSGILINPAALTHTSLGLYDALKAISNKIPAIEIHLSNTYSREEIRHKSLTAGACVGQIMGFQENSYNLGMSAIIKLLNTNNG